MKLAAFCVGWAVAALGVFGILAPSGMVWVAVHSLHPGAFVIVAAVRLAFGLVLFLAAPESRAPKTVRVLGVLFMISGVITAVTAAAAMDQARDLVRWWMSQDYLFVRATCVPILGLGGFIAYVCRPKVR